MSDANKEQNLNNVEDAEDGCVTMMDVLEQQEALEEDVEAVLGSGNDDSCTYDKGYMVRQPLYACLTCCPVGGIGGRAGVCLGCSLTCHHSHTLVELYTKRDFRCDCGNSKFVMNPCKLNPGKSTVNNGNGYNQNFDGVYCTCHRPYPDPDLPEGEEEDEMIQCCICEDWFHSKHLCAGTAPPGDTYSEMVCSYCITKLTFLKSYSALAVNVVKREAENTGKVDVVATSVINNGDNETQKNKESESVETKDAIHGANEKLTDGDNKNGKCNEALPGNSEEKDCTLGQHKGQLKDISDLFFTENWRRELCRCSSCMTTYSDLKVSFLLRDEDTISHYEQQARERRACIPSEQHELSAFDGFDRVTRTEMYSEFNTLSNELREYLRKFVESGKVVRDEDIKEFFSGLQARKKQRGTNGIPPNSCKW